MIIGSVILLIFAGLLAAAAVEDLRRLIIPNRLSIAIALLFPAYAIAAPESVDIIGSLQIAAISFAAGFALFLMRIAGGGDVKLFSAAALWTGPQHFASFVLVTAMTGAAIALAMLAARRLARPHAAAPDAAAGDSDSQAARRSELPYGAAIAAGGVAVALMHLIGD